MPSENDWDNLIGEIKLLALDIETEKFRALEVDDLFKLTPEKVYTEIEASLKTLIVN